MVVAYAIRRREGVLLFDTGFGFGSQELEERYHQKARWIEDVLGEVGIRLADVDVVANCHLHADHAGQNARMTGVPIYVQPAELEIARAGNYTIDEWIDGPGIRYVAIEGDHELVPGIRILSTPGHAPGHQSLVVDQPDGPVLLSGQAVYGLDEWLGQPGRQGRSNAPTRPPTTNRSLASGCSSRPGSSSPTTAGHGPTDRPRRPGYPCRAVLGGELAVPCTCNPLQQG